MKQYDLDDDLVQIDAKLECLYKGIVEQIEEDPARQGLIKTPYRAAKALQFLTQGYTQNVDAIVNGAIFDEEFDDMVIVRDIEFYSLCEHHILPFFGKCHVGYIPNKKIVGLSKVPRIIDMLARRLQVQERLTDQIAQVVNELIQPQGIAVVMEAQHMCMMIRGVEKQRSSTITNVMLGTFREKDSTRAEFLQSIK
ncbi:TPA: GTP cyclohydrolase I FolE [Candidatus Poribacteria bacterium]|nr:GTP cyclohydrolase I FolE [Candidatus Poribacteria bacterium]HIA68537.1 GTP cyclohydrolase I FolE [Candidatus Poribacteria bacterium]HIB98580.1 GTP cyclohydrolase I FolE [Candidatus Poribacteria bacterium]HIO47740.1 GTP cyclohydrolase I FolE [Candidatus Poribacteria bacterium]